MCVYLGVMSVEKQGTVKSELSPDGGLKLTIKREKTVEDAHKPEWVTEARGSGLGKLVIKRKGPGPVSLYPETTGLRVDKHTEQRPILRLSITSNASSDGNRHAQVKSWSLCEVSSAIEDVASAAELSPACQLQPSPKDSGIDISSPPHDDGAVGVEPNAATGIWSATDSHSGDSSAVEVEKMTGSLEKLETTVASFVHGNSAEHPHCQTLWPGTESRSCERNRPKVLSTLRTRGDRSAVKSIASSSQKLVNPLAKSCRVGRYQHMLPVNRIRAESNLTRRSSLEESPTYNMVTSRTSLFSRLPRVKTKLKLLSNNTYAPVFDQEVESNEQHAAVQKSKCLNVEKSSSAVIERKRNRISRKSSTSGAFKNMKVKLCFNDKNHRSSLGDDKIQKIPKLKLVVKSKPALSCIEQRFEDAAAEENIPRHARRKRRQRVVGKLKASSINVSADSLHATDGFNDNHLPSFKAADTRSCRTKHKSLEAKQVVDGEPLGKKSKLQSSTEPLASKSPELSELRLSFDKDHVDTTGIVQPLQCKVSADEAVCGTVMSLPSVHTDKLSPGHSSIRDASNKAHTAIEEEPGKFESISAAHTKASTVLAESDSDGTDAVHSSSVDIGREKQSSEGFNFDSEKCTVLNSLNVNTDESGSTVEGKLSLFDDSVAVVSDEVKHDCSTASDEEALIVDNPCLTITTTCADDRPTIDTPSDHSGNSRHTCDVFDENSTSVTVELPTSVCSDVVTLLTSPPSGSDDSVNTNLVISDSILLQDSNGSDINKAHDSSLSLPLKPAVVTEDTLSCVTVHNQNNIDVVNVCPVDLAETDFRYKECQQDVKQAMELCEKKSELESVRVLSDQDKKPGDECEQTDSDPLYSYGIQSRLMSLASPCYSKEHKETGIANSTGTGSNGFLAAFTQFVEKVSVKKKSASCNVVVTDNTLKPAKEIPVLSKSGSSHKSVRRRPFTSQRRRHSCSENQTLPENILTCHSAHSETIKSIECVSNKEASVPETDGSEDICSSERQTSTAADDECSTLCREDLLNVVSSHHQLVMLRHQVCELLETVLPELRFPFGFQRDSASVERFVKDITDILSNDEAVLQDIQQCSDPVVILHHMPDRCLQSLQQQVIRLLTLLIPDTDLSDVNGDSLDVFLELMTSVNRPLPGAFCISQSDVHLSQETSPQPLDKLELQGSSLCHADTNIKCEQVDTSVVRTDSHVSAVDTLFNTPSSLLQIKPSGPIGEKRSIRRQVKDCLMFLDRDLT